MRQSLWVQAFRQASVWRRAAVDRAVLLKSIISPLIGFTLVLVSAAETWVHRTASLNTEN
ncbi:MAG: hypothetical protein B9S33_04845 [Pedosphaera sp. Tous-C6FEB]|nr:MAG: hypothetical protein B9S33_04845 [Pedosphaera sp. Tous-C6FEB]